VALPFLCVLLTRHRHFAIIRHCKKIGSCWRKLTPGRQALLVLAHLRKGKTFAVLARSPKLRRSLADAQDAR
jgi:hypothetical protein